MSAHVSGGNCWYRKRSDVCGAHDEARGQCSVCPRCPACEGEATADRPIPPFPVPQRATEIETPASMARRVALAYPSPSIPTEVRGYYAMMGIDADREQIAAWCEEHAGAADREAEAHEEQVIISPPPADVETCEANDSHRDRARHCEGQASALRALAAILKGAK